ncbi:hypothetical protein U9M48_030987 [Paspalum notatum var. saurae]|uniref:Uncharacterized protein n=1 Tax=Paspalum notatum var. saurae TaxID=547442 RepID=A0AAQ3X3W4_PASNO
MQNARTGPTRLRAVSQPAWKRRRRRPAVARRRAPDSPCAAAAAARQHGSDSPRAAADEPWVTDRAAGGWVATPSPRSTRRPAVEPTSLPTHMRWPLAMWVLRSILRPPRRRSAVGALILFSPLGQTCLFPSSRPSLQKLLPGSPTGKSVEESTYCSLHILKSLQHEIVLLMLEDYRGFKAQCSVSLNVP